MLPKYGDGSWLHHHFYPGEPASGPEGATIDVRLYRAESTNELDVRFRERPEESAQNQSANVPSTSVSACRWT